jgi:hypothetical protein
MSKNNPPTNPSVETQQAAEPEKILCPYCLRTATNGIKCQGICVAENGY